MSDSIRIGDNTARLWRVEFGSPGMLETGITLHVLAMDAISAIDIAREWLPSDESDIVMKVEYLDDFVLVDKDSISF